MPPCAGKRAKLISFDEDVPDENESHDAASNPEEGGNGGSAAVAPERRFRGQRVETPSHPGEKCSFAILLSSKGNILFNCVELHRM